MSNIYISEPPTKGKVIMHTSMGDVDIELWAKETPLACRNFIQLCLEGYYDNTIFHRIVPEFCLQGGDPTGTGEGGESIYGKPFNDEFHSRLRFNRRGLLAMANSGKNDNGSQFFFTLGPTPELDRKHTLFGKIVGDTLFNVLKMGELEIDSETERPLYPPKIISIDVINNPFDDIIPRITSEEKKAQELAEKLASEKKKPKKKEKKRLNLLSFGAEEEDIDTIKVNTKIKSSHDLLKDDEHLSSEVAVDLSVPSKNEEKQKKIDEIKKNINEGNSNTIDNNKEKLKKQKSKDKKKEEKKIESVEELKSQNLQNIKDEINKVKKMYLDIGKKDPEEDKGKKEKGKKEKKRGLELLEKERKKYLNSSKAIIYKNKKKKLSRDEDDTLAKMLSFQNKLRNVTTVNKNDDKSTEVSKEKSEDNKKSEDDNNELCKLHNRKNCESCKASFNETKQKELLGELKDDDNDSDWLYHRLTFEDEGSKDIFKVDDYVVIDPRQREKESKNEYYSKKKESKIASSFRSNRHSHRK